MNLVGGMSYLRTVRQAPLTSAMVNRLVKKHARWAGLCEASPNGEHRARIHHPHPSPHGRHAPLPAHRRCAPEQLSLNHTCLNTTQIYLQQASKRTDNLWVRVDRLIGVD